jgi:Domain of unknown function (DUF4082)/PKD domain
MPTGWSGPDPVQLADGNDYELGECWLANVDVTITAIRVWSGPGEVSIANRRAHVWTTGGSLLGTVTLPDDLPDGWSQYTLDTPVERPAGQRWVASYMTGGNYGGVVDALASSDVVSSDGAVSCQSTGNATPNGNGVFNTTPGSFPTTSPASHPFYGVDVVYTLGLGGNTAPVIVSATATQGQATVTATVTATDAETLVGATYRYDWGDGSPVTVTSSATAVHTYTVGGLYGLLVSVTDAGGLADYAAVPVLVVIPDTSRLATAVKAAIDALALGVGVYVDAPPPNRDAPYLVVFDSLDITPARLGDSGSSTQDEAVYELCQVDYVTKRRTPDNKNPEDMSIRDKVIAGLQGNRLVGAPYAIHGCTVDSVLRLPGGEAANLVVTSITLRVAHSLRRAA